MACQIMACRSVLPKVRGDFKLPLLCRLLGTNSPTSQTNPGFHKVDFGAHLRTPSYKDICEDAYFIWSKYGIVAFGVADGVSGWRQQGVNAALFPNALMANCINHLEEHKGRLDAGLLVNAAYQDILENNEVEAGSSTVCIGIFDKYSGILQTANLGDSGFVIFRDGETFLKSKEQYHAPNVPYQIGVQEIKDGKSICHGNSPTDAKVCKFELQNNDIVIFGTDGLFDNLFLRDIHEIISNDSVANKSIDWHIKTKELTELALIRSLDTARLTPREKRMQEHYEDSLDIPGGNFDDVAVVAAQIKSQYQ